MHLDATQKTKISMFMVPGKGGRFDDIDSPHDDDLWNMIFINHKLNPLRYIFQSKNAIFIIRNVN